MSEPGGNLRQRAPLRFVWQMDAEHRFTVGSGEFADLMGRATAAALGRPWPEVAAALSLDPDGHIARALASRETWSGLSIAWPAHDGCERVTVELSGLPIFDRERVFRGYRGFGICRDFGRARAPAGGTPVAGRAATMPASENVVALRPSEPPVAPALSPLERNAFHELTRKLRERLTGPGMPGPFPAAQAPRLDVVEVAREAAARSGEHRAIETGAADPLSAVARAQGEIRALKSMLEPAGAGRETPDRQGARPPEKPSQVKSDFLAELSHIIRTPLNTIIGFSEMMRQEKLGPIDARYRQYLRDIQSSGEQLLSQVNDMLDLSRIEAGKLELDFAGVALNPLTQQCVALLQPQANRERIVIRTSLPPRLPPVIADARSVRQMVLNLIAHSTRLAGAGGQVILSTTLTDLGEVVLRIRDSGNPMSETEIALVLEPFRQTAPAVRRGPADRCLGLPLTKALAEANRATFSIKNAPHAGTLIQVAFPPDRVLAADAVH
jgi:signal transduction histidine kinase